MGSTQLGTSSEGKKHPHNFETKATPPSPQFHPAPKHISRRLHLTMSPGTYDLHPHEIVHEHLGCTCTSLQRHYILIRHNATLSKHFFRRCLDLSSDEASKAIFRMLESHSNLSHKLDRGLFLRPERGRIKAICKELEGIVSTLEELYEARKLIKEVQMARKIFQDGHNGCICPIPVEHEGLKTSYGHVLKLLNNERKVNDPKKLRKWKEKVDAALNTLRVRLERFVIQWLWFCTEAVGEETFVDTEKQLGEVV
ncbi:hypothetical protein FN846DRAFT_941937 [Sphaerosporella brunnea]|uniref:Uncharacterized protein n=1 Tax=Sphaerosporella brunnea TaxID=1250544 RepID=A0A5J5F0U0_9PEZI|nr:hypothetical protein FN846DRAFT_941937 [Sphaerosporella brunnea]